MDKILVTGGAGFIGSNLAHHLERIGYEVTIIDNLSSGNKKNLKNFKGRSIVSDISRSIPLNKKFDTIFHLAAITDTTFGNDKEMIRQNLAGFKNIFKLAKKYNSKLIYASSAAIYGNGPTPMRESQTPIPLNAYAKSKLEADKLAVKYFDKMHIVGLRYFNVFGPGESFKGKSSSMIYQLAVKMISGERPKLFKYGEQKRDFIFIDDVIQATIQAMDARKSGIYNVGTGVSFSFNQIVKILNKYLECDFKPVYFENKNSDSYQNLTCADTRKAKKYLDFTAKYRLTDAVKIYTNYIRRNDIH